jgi:Ca2+-binding EF-hand superfamily protein
MKHSNSMWAGVMVLTLASAVATFADTPTAGTGKAKAASDEMKAMDTNGDGKISPEEHAAGAARMFEAMDANKDGKVTAAEMDAAHERVTGQKAVKGELTAADKIKAIDTDGDGVLTAEEHAAGSRKMFTMMDTDQDGFLSKEELAAGHAKMMNKAAH